jgi:hypothetical protein
MTLCRAIVTHISEERNISNINVGLNIFTRFTVFNSGLYCSSVGLVTGCGPERQGSISGSGNFFLFTSESSLAAGHIQHYIKLKLRVKGVKAPGV